MSLFDSIDRSTNLYVCGNIELAAGLDNGRTYLFQQQITVGRQAGDQILGQTEERTEHILGEVFA
jgi:hypothetical protein